MALGDLGGRAWHALAPREVLSALESDGEWGLGPEEVAGRRRRFGENALPKPKRRPLALVFLAQLTSPLIYLLIAAAGIALALGNASDAAVIGVVVLLNAVIGAIQEGRAERSIEALEKLGAQQARVIRGGVAATVEAREVVPGDLLLLSAGDLVAADGRVIESSALSVSEAALTGESVPVGKTTDPVPEDTPLADRTGMVHAGTHATYGRARVAVTGTGAATEIGKIAELAGHSPESKTPLEKRVAAFGRHVIVAAFGLLAVILALGLLRGVPFAEIAMVGLSQIVGLVPEGLPAAMTIALAVGVQRMSKRRALVRRLSAVETLGSTTVICTDKTGTLTRNEMAARAVHLPSGRNLDVSYPPVDPELITLASAAVLCSDATAEHGDPTEVALIHLAKRAGIDVAHLRERAPRTGEIPFDAARRMMATEHAAPDGPCVIVKGAPEQVLELCRGRRDLHLAAAERMAGEALRVLAVAVADGARLTTFADLAGRAVFLGLIGEIDPPRAEVKEAVARAKAAGIRPVMVTGDHRVTGLAIARELGIAGENSVAIEGRELAKMTEQELAARVDNVSVFARVEPDQKLRIVGAYQARGEVVAMTGDGVNDAPALVRADVGIAMGKTGTDLSKSSAKIVIADDNFATIVAAVEEGRTVYRNIKKAILLLVSTSLAEVLVLLGAMALGFPPPFAAVQILWNNLVTEGLITINLIMEPGEGDEMTRPPIARDEPLLSRALLSRVAVMTPAITVSTLGWFSLRVWSGVPFAQAQTETFTLLAVAEWFNVLNVRSERRSAFRLGLLRNPWLLGGLAAGNLLQIAVVFWRPLGDVFHTAPIPLEDILWIGVAGSLVLWVEELRKKISASAGPRSSRRRRSKPWSHPPRPHGAGTASVG